MKNLTCVATLLVCATSAFARIGETEAQIDARYGKPSSSEAKNNSKTYFYRGFHIIVAFDGGVSVVEQYWKELSLPMSTMELASLLAANSGGAKWPMPEQDGYDFRYKTRNRVGVYNALTHRFMVATPAGVDRVLARSAASDAQKMKGF